MAVNLVGRHCRCSQSYRPHGQLSHALKDSLKCVDLSVRNKLCHRLASGRPDAFKTHRQSLLTNRASYTASLGCQSNSLASASNSECVKDRDGYTTGDRFVTHPIGDLLVVENLLEVVASRWQSSLVELFFCNLKNSGLSVNHTRERADGTLCESSQESSTTTDSGTHWGGERSSGSPNSRVCSTSRSTYSCHSSERGCLCSTSKHLTERASHDLQSSSFVAAHDGHLIPKSQPFFAKLFVHSGTRGRQPQLVDSVHGLSELVKRALSIESAKQLSAHAALDTTTLKGSGVSDHLVEEAFEDGVVCSVVCKVPERSSSAL